MRRHQANAAPEHRTADLLSTIKLPKNAIDISGCLPEPRYEISQIPEIPPSQESAGDIAGGTAKAPPRSHGLGGRGPSLLPNRSADEGDSSKLDLDSYQDSLDAYLSPPPPQQRGGPLVPPVHHQPPSVAPLHHQPPSASHLPNINQSHAGGDSLDTYVQRQQVRQHQQPRQQRVASMPGSEYGDHGAEESQQRLPRHASPAPSGQASRAPMPIYSQQPAHAQQQAYGQQQYRQPRGNIERRPMASYARQQYALGPGGSHAGSAVSQAAPPRQPTGGGGGLRLPRIFSKAS